MIKKSIIILLFIIFVFDIYFFLIQKKTNCLNERLSQKQIDINIFKNQMSNLYSSESISIQNCDLYLNNSVMNLRELSITKPILVLRFSIFNCSTCVDFTLEKLQEHFHDFALNKRIIIVYDDENMRVSESMFGKMPYVTTNRYILGLPIEKSNIPFMFIVDSTLITKQLFIPEKGMPSLTDEYLSIIKTRYFNN